MPTLIAWWTQDVLRRSSTASSAGVAAAGAELLRRWTEPHRRYHTTRHLVEMFWSLEEITDAGELDEDDATLARLAAWLHDAVYDPSASPGANESGSARLATSLLSRVGLGQSDIDAVVGLVEMTSDHTVRVDGSLQRAFHDADLWILTAPVERFDAYCALVREEYASVPEALFCQARSRILRGLLTPDGPYLTDYGRANWAVQALENIDRELERLA